MQREKCIKPRDWRDIPDDGPWMGHYCVDRSPDTCNYFKFDISKRIFCEAHKSIEKRLRKIYKTAISLERECTGVSSLMAPKDAVTEIIKIIEKLWESKK